MMAITYHIPGPLRNFTGGRSDVTLEVSPATLRDALIALWAAYPGLRDRIANEQGDVREHVNVFVGNENSKFSGGLAMLVPPSSEITIVAAVSGGTLRCE